MAELAFEYLLAALEVTPGTAIDPPTHYLKLAGTIAPKTSRYRPEESNGTLAEHTRSKIVRQWSEWEAEGALDVYILPLILRAMLKGSVTPSTPGGGTNSRLWTFAPTMTADDLETMTIYWGDPNVQAFQAAYGLPDELTIGFDASGEEGASLSVSGMAHFPAKDAPDSVPSQLNPPLIAPGNLEVWLDTSSAIGTTAITGRVLGGEFRLTNNVSRKWWAVGAGGTLDYSGHGRGKRHAELTLRFEVPDMDEYDLYTGGSVIKARVRLNGPLIEGSLYHYVQLDVYGPADAIEWGDNQSTNRVLELTIISEYNVSAGHDFQILVQNDRASL